MAGKPTRIEISGGIASGKTTLANLLTENSEYGLALERFRENPFWPRFYERPDLYSVEKNFCFLAQHTGEVKGLRDTTLVICDYAVVQDLAYASLSDVPGHLAAMELAFEHLYAQLPPPALIVNLRCNPVEQLRRIRERSRKEEARIDVEYLSSLNDAIGRALARYASNTRTHEIRSDAIDFAHDIAMATEVKRTILSIVGVSSD
jgi:deoxyadenosine/deoxycytidine kinase